MRQHIEDSHDGPICKKCGKPMMSSTWVKGIGVKQYWFCPDCKTRVACRG